MNLLGFGKKILNSFRKPKLFKLQVSSIFSTKGTQIVTFTNSQKSKIPGKYLSKLVIGNIVEFYGYKNKTWINLSKEPQLKVLRQAEVKKITGTLDIKYVSRFMKDEMGEYVYLPNCTLKYDNKTKKSPALIYLSKVSLKSEKDGLLQGYGKLNGSFSFLGDIISVDKIENFKPEIRSIDEKFNLSEVRYHIKSLSVKTSNGTFNCLAKNVPFSFTPSHNNFKGLYDDMSVSITAIQRKIGKVHKENNKWIEVVEWAQYGEYKWDFTNIDNSKIAKQIEQQEMDEEYEKLLIELQELKDYVSFSDLKEKFKNTGRTVSNKDLSEMFFHSGYDKDVFQILEDKAIETFVDNLSFVFKIPSKKDGENIFVWEVPNMTLATYVFSDTLMPEQLFSRLKETKRMDIRTNNEIKDFLGIKGFIVHSNFKTWNEKFIIYTK